MNILDGICKRKRADLARWKADTPLEALREQVQDAPPPRGFLKALEAKKKAGGFALIAEIKKASPSAGVIREDFSPADLARSYESAGAACLSVLTDEPHFKGRPAYLRTARAATALPVLRKDFMLDPWQVYEARSMGADCILLILAALTDKEARELEATALGLGMDVLIEVHDGVELERALALTSPLIGINNRNLKTLNVDIATAERLADRLPDSVHAVAESGLRTHDDLRHMANAGITSFLVGESLMRQDDLAAATRRLLTGKDD